MNRAGILRLVRPISIRSRKPAVVSSATRAPRRSSTALVPTVVPCTRRRTSALAMPSAASPARTASASWWGRDGTLVTTTRPVSASTAVRSVKVPPTSMPTMYMAQSPAWSSTTPRRAHEARGAVGDVGHADVGGLAARPAAVELDHDHHRLPEREGLPPAHRAGIGAGPRDVAGGDLRARGQPHVGEPRPRPALRRLRVRRIGPVVEQGAEVHQRVAEGRHVPVEDGGHAVGVLRGRTGSCRA